MRIVRVFAPVIIMMLSAGLAFAGGSTAFNYQGRLLDAGQPANGLFDFEFRLWDADMSGSQIGSTQIHNAVSVADGLFLILLDFGADAFDNADRWLSVTVDTVLLSPRQPVTRVPYAIQTRGIFVDAGQNVGIGTTAPAYRLEVVSDRSRTINARNTATSGAADGVWGSTASSSGWGVFGFAGALSGSTNGTRGQSLSTTGTGVLGLANAGSGNNIGVSGESTSPDGTGVLGVHSASSGTAPGVLGKTNSTSASAIGVLGRVNSASPGSFSAAVRGENLGTSGFGIGVWGSQDGSGWGVYGTTSGGIGVFGSATAASGTNYGVYGESNSTSGYDFFADGVGMDYGSSSSIRWKSNVRNIDQPLEMIARLRGVYFDWDKDHGGHHDVGMIAEEVGEVLPEIVNYEENGIDAIGMDYSKLTPLLVEAIKELHSEVEYKDSQITELQDRLTALEALVDRLVLDRNGGAQ